MHCFFSLLPGPCVRIAPDLYLLGWHQEWSRRACLGRGTWQLGPLRESISALLLQILACQITTILLPAVSAVAVVLSLLHSWVWTLRYSSSDPTDAQLPSIRGWSHVTDRVCFERVWRHPRTCEKCFHGNQSLAPWSPRLPRFSIGPCERRCSKTCHTALPWLTWSLPKTTMSLQMFHTPVMPARTGLLNDLLRETDHKA